MVLQRSRPIAVWGYDAQQGETLDIVLDFQQGGEVAWAEAVAGKAGKWRATLSVPPSEIVGQLLKLSLTRRGAQEPDQVLEDVVLGDLYLFSGQSNVDLPVSYVHQFNARGQEEEERSADELGRTGMLRLMIVPARCGLSYHDGRLSTELPDVQECRPCPPPFSREKARLSDVNSCNLLGGHSENYTYCNCDSLRWARSSGDMVRGFSAVAWFFGKALLASDAAKGVPIGLVRSSWGATNIAVWSGVDALEKCPQEGDVPTSFAPYVKSALWGHMIYPLRGLQLSATIWVHGARNLGGLMPYMGGQYYSCALRAMIQDWREKLEQEHLPFLVVESPVYCNELDYRTWHTWCDDRDSQLKFPDEHLPEMRMAQNQAESLPNVYLVSVMDQGSLRKAMGGAIHSERKPELGMRLAVAARAAVYGDSGAVWSGPVATSAWKSSDGEVSVCFDMRGGGSLRLNESAICPSVVLPVYCTGATFELLAGGVWYSPDQVSLRGNEAVLALPQEAQHPERVRYAWADWPVCSVLSSAGMPARLFNIPVHYDPDVESFVCPEDSPAGSLRKQVAHGSFRGTTTTTTTAAAPAAPLRDPQAMRAIAILASIMVSLPMLAVAAIAARWHFRGHPWAVKLAQHHPLKPGAHSFTPDVPECEVLEAVSSDPSSVGSADSQAHLVRKANGRNPAPRAVVTRSIAAAQRPASREARGNSRDAKEPRTAPRSTSRSQSPNQGRSVSPPSGSTGSKRVVRNHAEEAPLLRHGQKEPAKPWFRVVGSAPSSRLV